ncbi:hypothetical protein D3C80_2177210 [compost metagenome]
MRLPGFADDDLPLAVNFPAERTFDPEARLALQLSLGYAALADQSPLPAGYFFMILQHFFILRS